MKNILSLFLISSIFLVSCSQIRDSAGVNRKNIDEFRVIENPPLIIPPDFNLLPPEQLKEKKISNAESELAKEILFGLNTDNNTKNNQLSTMESILNQTNTIDAENTIRQDINEQFASEKQIKSKTWDDQIDILDSINESKKLRNKRLGNDIQYNEELPTKKIKKKKKKRFFFF